MSFQDFVKEAAEKASKAYLDEQQDPKQVVAKIAQDNDLNGHEIERIANRTNQNIIVQLQKKAVCEDVDPHTTFPTVKTSDVIGIIDKGERDSPSVPDSESKIDMDDILPVPEHVDVPGAPDEDPQEIAESGCIEFSFNDRELGARVLQRMKERVAEKRQKAQKLERQLDEVIRDLKKQAKKEALNGTPAEVLAEVGSDVVDKVAKEYDAPNAQTPFHLNEDHEMFKMAERADQLRDEVEEAKDDYEFEKRRLEHCKHEVFG